MTIAPTISTQRLTLRESRLADYETIAALWGNADVVRYIGGQTFSRHESWMRFLRMPGLWALLGYGYWSLVENDTQRVVGQVGFGDFKREMSCDISGIPEAGWVISPEFHNKGYATESMQAALAWCDHTINAERTCCLIDPQNDVSIRLAQKLGYGDPQKAKLGDADTLVFYRSRCDR